MRTALRELLDTVPEDGTFSIWWGPAVGDPWLEHAADATHYAASTMKLILLIAVHRAADRGQLRLDDQVVIHDDFDSQVSGAGFTMARDYDNDDQPWERIGEPVTLRWLGSRAIVRSSNLATNLLLESVGVSAVQETHTALGLSDSTFARGIEDAAAASAGIDNRVSARDLATTLRALLDGSAATPAACREIVEVLAAQELRDTIPAGLPRHLKVAHKSGWVDGVSHDAGIILPADGQPLVLVVCTTSGLDEQAGRKFVASAAAAAWADHQKEVR